MALWAAVALTSLQAAPALAASKVERPYDPPPGSRWTIDTAITSDETTPAGPRSLAIKTHAEMTIEQRTAGGFRILYVNRGVTVEGNGQALLATGAVLQVLDNVEIRATTDPSGKPLYVENLDEVRAAMRGGMGTLTGSAGRDPQTQAAIGRAVAGLIEASDARMVPALTGALTDLARAQNTGLEPGKYRHVFTEADNPLGGHALRCNALLHIADADPVAGRLTVVSTFSYDSISKMDFLRSIGQKFLAAVGAQAKAAEIEVIVQRMAVDLDGRAVFEVEDGMTRKITETSVTSTHAMGRDMSRIESRVVTVTRAP